MAHRSSQLSRWLGRLPRVISCDVRGLGAVSATLERVDLARAASSGARPFEHAVALSIRAPGQGLAAVLEVEQTLALSLVRAALGAPPPLVSRVLAPAERGVLGAILGQVLSSVEHAAWIDLRAADQPEEPVQVLLTLRSPGAVGPVRFTIPGAWLERNPSTLPLADGPSVDVGLSLVAATTLVAAADLASLCVGDAVVFDGVAPLGPTSDWPVDLWFLADRSASASGIWKVSGELAATGPLFAVQPARDAREATDAHSVSATPPTSELTMPDRLPRQTDANPSRGASSSDRIGPEAPIAPDRLGAIPVEVRVEVGRVQMRIDEIAGLARGAVVVLGARHPRPVTLLIGDRPWAEGDLTVIDEQLAVQVTEVFAARR
jgi:type III secretion system YscQ/HrcQ family protein